MKVVRTLQQTVTRCVPESILAIARYKPRLALLFILFLACPLLFLSACKKREVATVSFTPTSSDPIGKSLFPVSLATDWYAQPEHGGFYYAAEHGYYKDEGLRVNIIQGGPSIQPEKMVAAGNAEFGMSSSDGVLTAVSRGLPLIGVGATMQYDPQGIMAHTGSGVDDFSDLEGRTIAVMPGATWFKYVVKKFNLKEVREVPPTYNVLKFLQDKSYVQQIFITSEPYDVKEKGVTPQILLIKDSGYDPYRVFFTNRDFLNAYPDKVRKFVKASIKGWRDYMTKDPSLTHKKIMQLNEQKSPEKIDFSYQAMKEGHFIAGDPEQDEDYGEMVAMRWFKMYSILMDLGILTNEYNPADSFTLEFLSE